MIKSHPTLLDLYRMIDRRLLALEEVLFEKPEGDWITEKQAAKEFHYSLSSIKRFRKQGRFNKINSTHSGRKIRLSRKELKRVLELKIA